MAEYGTCPKCGVKNIKSQYFKIGVFIGRALDVVGLTLIGIFIGWLVWA